jgi:hypothetical protein
MKFAGERRALAAVVFIFYAIAYAVLALSALQPALGPSFYALAGVYALAFFAIVAGYFWARWYAIGVGIYGVIVGAIGMWQLGSEPLILFIGGTHLAAVLMLWGEGMSFSYDGKKQWRERFHMDDNAVQRLGRSVIRAGVSLPIVLLYALAPKQPAEAVAAAAAFMLAGFGLRALVQMKTWGVVALGASGAMMVALGAADVAVSVAHPAFHHTLAMVSSPMLSLGAGVLLISAAAPFMRSMLRYARSV